MPQGQAVKWQLQPSVQIPLLDKSGHPAATVAKIKQQNALDQIKLQKRVRPVAAPRFIVRKNQQGQVCLTLGNSKLFSRCFFSSFFCCFRGFDFDMIDNVGIGAQAFNQIVEGIAGNFGNQLLTDFVK